MTKPVSGISSGAGFVFIRSTRTDCIYQARLESPCLVETKVLVVLLTPGGAFAKRRALWRYGETGLWSQREEGPLSSLAFPETEAVSKSSP